jgi:predicted neutral ceramidase superfamily lipid hydrolase
MMEEIKNENKEQIVESEEVVEVALAGEEQGEEVSEGMEYTEAEMSGLTEAQRKRKEIFDKITTGILIALLVSPVAIILYIFLWFIFR